MRVVVNHKSLLPFAAPEEPKLPPYEQAIKELDEIKTRKLWQQGLNKEYYTALTETLRRYIVERFGVNAMEMTSGEILDTLQNKEEVHPVFDKLKQILSLSDFVKFAKVHPLPDENDLSISNAYSFVEETKPEETTPEKGTSQQAAEESNNEAKIEE